MSAITLCQFSNDVIKRRKSSLAAERDRPT